MTRRDGFAPNMQAPVLVVPFRPGAWQAGMARAALEAFGAVAAVCAFLWRCLRDRGGAAAVPTHEVPAGARDMEAFGQLTGHLAHDFNNILTGISGSLDLMACHVAQNRFDALPRYVAAAQEEARRAAALTQRLLAFSSRQALDPKPVNVNALLDRMDGRIRRTAGPGIVVSLHAAVDAWPSVVDAAQLEAAVLGLCANARDAMPAGGRLTVRTANLPLGARAAQMRGLLPGCYLRLAVTDTGTGMTPEVAARALEPFFTTKRLRRGHGHGREHGTGLGLSTIYGFARQSGGRVHLRSVPGRGTTVCLYLPRHHGPVSPVVPKPFPAHASVAAGATVLVVEDEGMVRRLVSEALSRRGYRVLEAEDAVAGLAAVQAGGRIDLLLTDVGLPGAIDGCQLADAVQRMRPGLPVLFMTGYSGAAALRAALLGPDRQVIGKPFALAALADQVGAMATRPVLAVEPVLA